MLLQDYLERHAVSRPQKVVLITGSEHLTYDLLNRYSTTLACALKNRGLVRGDRVALFLPNSEETVLGIFAALKADGAFVVLNPKIKFEKLSDCLNDCRAAALITGNVRHIDLPTLVEAVPSLKVVVVCGTDGVLLGERFLSLRDALAQEIDMQLLSQNIDIDLAYIIYTSGSTGIPKGVMMTHRSAISAATSIISYLENTADETILNCLPLSFDYGLYQVLMSVMLGGTVVLEEGFNYPKLVIDRLKKLNVTGFPLIPTMASVLLEMESFNGKNLPSLRYITCTGAVLAVEYIKKMQLLFPHAKVFSMYGLTECKRVSYLPPEQLSIRPLSVGKGMPNEEIYIADENGAAVSPGEVGELVVRGSNVMLGYWERPEETAEVLREGRYPGERVLYTGDLFRTDNEGYLYFVGRKDDMIKTRGERVGPAEIERVLLRMPGIKEAAVVGIPDRLLGQAVAAYVVPAEKNELDTQSVKRFVAERMEDFMVPKVVHIIPRLPRTSNGKIDKSLLANESGIKNPIEGMSTPHKRFLKDLLTIDCSKAVERIGHFMRKSVCYDFNKRGTIVGLSGGVDSSVTAVLARQALGRERVLGLILPEREADPLSEQLARTLAIQFDIPTEIVDLSKACESLGVYARRYEIVRNNFPEYDPAIHRYKLVLPDSLLDGSNFNIYKLALVAKDGTSKTRRLSREDYLEIVAATSIKQRLRMVMLYFYAERENYVVIGTTNKTELDLGFFVRYGDGGVDIEPLAEFYKIQVYQLASFLGIPKEIIQRLPTADVYPAMSEDREFYFRLRYEELDPLLYAWEQDVPLDEVMQAMCLTREQVMRVYHDFAAKKRISTRLKQPPIGL